MTERRRRPRASNWETLGAWLRIWTPPRDVDVPPVPRLRLAVAAMVAGACVTAILAVAVPRIEESKRGAAERDERADARAARQAAARTRLVQRPRTGGLRFRAAEPQLVAALQLAITRDARARRERGEVANTATLTRCTRVRSPRTALRPGRAAYDCLARTRLIPRGPGDRAAGSIGYAYRAVADLRGSRWTFCKVDLIPGELLVPDPRTVVPLPAACRS